MATLREELEEAEGRIAHLRRQIAASGCAKAGHKWKHLGGKNCGCFEGSSCSLPVHECEVCGDCDYGENRWSTEQIAKCRDYGPLADQTAALEGDDHDRD